MCCPRQYLKGRLNTYLITGKKNKLLTCLSNLQITELISLPSNWYFSYNEKTLIVFILFPFHYRHILHHHLNGLPNSFFQHHNFMFFHLLDN